MGSKTVVHQFAVRDQAWILLHALYVVAEGSPARAACASRYPADALLALDNEGRIATLNPAAEKMFSLPATHAIGHSLQNVPAFRERLGQLRTIKLAEQLRSLQSIPGLTILPIVGSRA
jgi:PAS domain-containing protein